MPYDRGMTELAVFDWNGTIIADAKASWIAGNTCLEYLGAPPITFARSQDTFTFPIIHYFKLNGVDVDRLLEHQDESNRLFHEHYEALSARSRTRRGARTLLRWLKDRDIPCIILSNHIEDKIRLQLARLGLDGYFRHVSANRSGTEVYHKISKLERLSAYIGEHGFDPARTVIIGDSLEEPDLARHLGMTCISVTGGFVSAGRLRAHKKDHLVHSLTEIIPLLRDGLE